MSLHFHAQQFNQPYFPRRLRNWEIPREFELTRPHARTGRTQIIANNCGHLLPGVPRPQRIGSGPWGHFVPTWRLPKKITRDIAVGLRDPKPKLVKTKTPTEEHKEPEKKEEQIEEDPCKDKPDKLEQPAPICPIHG